MWDIPTLEIGTSKIICMIAAPDRSRNLPISAILPYEGIKEGSFIDRSRAENAIVSVIEDAEVASSRQIGEIIVGVPGCFLKLEKLEVSTEVMGEKVSRGDIDALRRQAMSTNYADAKHIETRFAYFTDDDGEIYAEEPIGQKTYTLSACVVNAYASREFTDVVENALAKLKIDIACYVGEGLAQALHYIPAEERDKSAILLDIGQTETTVSAVYADAVLAEATIDMGSFDITGDLAIAIDADIQTAQNLRRNYIFGIDADHGDLIFGKDETGRMRGYDVVKVRSTIEKRMRIILGEITKALASMNDVLFPRAAVYLSGADSQTRGITQFIASVMEKEVISVYKSGNMLSAEYNTSLALLDNEAHSLYDLKKDHSQKKSLNEKFLGLFR